VSVRTLATHAATVRPAATTRQRVRWFPAAWDRCGSAWLTPNAGATPRWPSTTSC